MAEIIYMKIQLNWKIDKDEAFWKQRAHINWLSLGDKTRPFFHKCASQWKKQNEIIGLEQGNGWVTKDKVEMELIARTFF